MIGAEELKFLDPGRVPAGTLSVTLEELEMNHIKATLAACDGNMSLAAKRLGINRSTLSRKMKRYRLSAQN
jgi:sigma-54 dependent transcriptional regulator, acetoin dehydrogenase operon transcriptional activator AcoR